MANLQQIQQALINMNETLFEEMCGVYLSFEFPLHRSFNPQSHKTKQKTKKGTPDISFKLIGEGYLFVQVTTRKNVGKSLIEKLKGDVKDCFNIGKTKIEVEKIKEIALCYNEQIKPSDEELINDFAKKEFNIVPHHFGLKRIAKDILFKYHFIGREYLKLEFGTGQIVSINQFIKTYESGGQSLATPLNNHYFERNQDLPNLINSIINNNIVIIHGVAGSGKSKLAIEGIKKFIEEETEYIDLALFPNGGDLIPDLYSEIINSKKYILFVDDINRLEQFTSVLAHYRRASESSLKLVLTVRDYAYSEAKSKLLGLKYSVIQTERFSDDEIRDLVEAAPFNIKNSKFRFKISSIAKGNPRLAIMAAKLALEYQNIEVLDSVFNLFDEYFTSFIFDNDILNEPINLKVLGLLSFFNTIEHEKGREIEKLSSYFKLDENKIIDSIEKLHSHDLILLNFGYAKVGEQNLATYFYYKVFIKDKLLSISGLLNYYFSTHSNRFSDSIKSIIEHFGVESLDNVKPLVKKYWQEQDLELRQQLSFLDIFRQIIPNDVLVFIENYIESLPKITNPVFKIEENKDSDYSFISEPNALRLLFNFYNDLIYLDDALQISFSLIKKKPDLFNKLIQNLKNKFGKSFNDEQTRFDRQHKLIDYLIAMSKKEEGDLFKISLIAVSVSILSTFKWDTEGVKSEDVNEDLVDSIKSIREKLKRFLYENVENFSEEILEVLLDNTINNVAISRETHEYDLAVTSSLIVDYLVNSNFRHCLLVHEECWLMNKLGSTSKELTSIKDQFFHPAYETFIHLNRERLRGKVDFEFENSDEFDQLKTADQKQFFHFRSIKEVDNFIEHLRLILNWEFLSKHSLYQLRHSIYIILEENNRQNLKIGFHLLCELISFFDQRKETVVDASCFKLISSKNETLEKLWEFIVFNDLKPIWKLLLLDSIPPYRIELVHYDRLIKAISINKSGWYSLKNFEKYSKVDSQVIEKIVKQITDLNEKGGDYKIWLDREFHESLVENNQLELAKESYLQQYFMNKHFDHRGKALLSILENDRKFLNVLLENIVENQTKLKAIEHRELSVVWELEDAEEVIDKAILMMVETNSNYTIGEDFINTFFYESHLRSGQVNSYLLNLIKKYYYRVDVVNIAFNVINYSKKDVYDKAFVTYLNKNQSKSDFEQINWFENQILYPGGANVSKIKINRLGHLLNLVEEHEKSLDLIGVKRYIRSKIEHQEDIAVLEESWNFLKETW